jgi:hypothetical protein
MNRREASGREVDRDSSQGVHRRLALAEATAQIVRLHDGLTSAFGGGAPVFGTWACRC